MALEKQFHIFEIIMKCRQVCDHPSILNSKSFQIMNDEMEFKLRKFLELKNVLIKD